MSTSESMSLHNTNENGNISSDDIIVNVTTEANHPSIHGEQKQEEELLLLASTEQQNCHENDIDQTKTDTSECQTIPDYWNISNKEFKEDFLMMLHHDDTRHTKVKQWLETDVTILQAARQQACLMAEIHFLKMEQDLWQTYRNVTRPEVFWLSSMAKSEMKRSRISLTFFKTEQYLQKHLPTIEQQYKNAIYQMVQYLEQQTQHSHPFPDLPLSIIDRTLLSALIIEFVREDRRRLRDQFEEKGKLLMLIANDIRLVKAFYDLKPTAEQLIVARNIWQATSDEQQAKEKLNALKQDLLKDDDNDIDKIMYEMLYDSSFHSNDNQSWNEKEIPNYKQLYLANETAIATVEAQNYANIIEDEKKTFLALHQWLPSMAPSEFHVRSMTSTIESRQIALIKRLQLIDQFQKTFSHGDKHDDDDNNYNDGGHINDSDEYVNNTDDDDSDDSFY